MRQIPIRFVFFLLVGAQLLSSCTKSQGPLGKKIFRICFQSQPMTIDPRRSGDPFSSNLLFMLFEGLTHLESDGNVSMGVAKSVEISQDLKTYTFHLKDSIWSDGQPVRALDFEKTWKRVLDPKFPSISALLFYPIKNAAKAKQGLISVKEVGVKALDRNTLVVELEYPTPYFLKLVSFCSFFPVPSHIQDMHESLKFDPQKQFVSNGPFTLKSWEYEDKIILQKNMQFWNESQTYLDEIFIHILSSEMTALQMYEKKELDLIGGFISPPPLEAIPSLIKEKKIISKPIAGTMICTFNTENKPFQNEQFRKAFSYSINRNEITKNITQTNEIIATGAIPPILKLNKFRHFFRDNDQLLAQECLKKGKDQLKMENKNFPVITLSYFTNELQHALAQTLQAQWKSTLGIEVRLEKLDFPVFLDKILRRQYDLALISWIAQYFDQMNILERFQNADEQKNYPGWENTDYIKLIESSMNMPSPDDRQKALENAETILMDQMPFAPIFHFNQIYLKKNFLTGVDITPIGNFDFRHTDIVY